MTLPAIRRRIAITTLILLPGLALTPSVVQAQANPNELLRRAIARVRESAAQLSRLVCTESLERIEVTILPHPAPGCRWWRGPLDPETPAAGPSQQDRVRVDVLFTSKGELYSWPGEARFNDQDLPRLVRIRPLSTGGFASFLELIFASGNEFTSRGEVVVERRRLREYSFSLPREKCGYRVGTGATGRAIACEGTFAVDPDTAELVRLVVRSSEAPESSGICTATTTLMYRGTAPNNSQPLLPLTSLFDLATTDGKEDRNTATYSGCRKFSAQSTVRFDTPESPAPTGGPVTYSFASRLPDGLPFRIVLTQPIVFNKIAAGDTVEAKLSTPIVDESKSVLVPAGTRVVFRVLNADIVRARRATGSVTLGHLILRIESLTVSGRLRPLTATTAQRIETSDPAARADDSPRNSNASASIRQADVAPLILAPNTVMLEFFGIHPDFVVKPGLQSKWRTGSAGPSPECLEGVRTCR